MKTPSELRSKIWISQSTCGLNCLVGKREGVGEILDRGTWISFNLSYSPGPRADFKAVQVPTGKPALPEKQVGRSLRTCWHWHLVDEKALCGVKQFHLLSQQGKGSTNTVRPGGGSILFWASSTLPSLYLRKILWSDGNIYRLWSEMLLSAPLVTDHTGLQHTTTPSALWETFNTITQQEFSMWVGLDWHLWQSHCLDMYKNK